MWHLKALLIQKKVEFTTSYFITVRTFTATDFKRAGVSCSFGGWCEQILDEDQSKPMYNYINSRYCHIVLINTTPAHPQRKSYTALLLSLSSVSSCWDNWTQVNTVYLTVSALPTLRKYSDCNMQQRQIFKWHQVATFGYENSERRSRVGSVVLL